MIYTQETLGFGQNINGLWGMLIYHTFKQQLGIMVF